MNWFSIRIFWVLTKSQRWVYNRYIELNIIILERINKMIKRLTVGQMIVDLEENEIGVVTEVGFAPNDGQNALNEDTFLARFHAGYPNSKDTAEIIFEKNARGTEWDFSD